MERIDCVIAGAGVIGLAIARALALAGREVIVLEATDMIGTGTSSRNSEVIHAGIYYPKDSLKAKFCVSGKEMLYRFVEEHGVAYRRCGKLIVATNAEQDAKLIGIREKASSCGVSDLLPLTRKDVLALEPELDCSAALLSPSTGIIDSHGFMLALQGEAEARGASIAFMTKVLSGRVTQRGIELTTLDTTTGNTLDLEAKCFVNAAGLEANALACRVEGLDASFVPKLTLAKGNYFSATGRTPFSHLIYPVPEDGGLGVHLTLDLNGRMRFGPDVEWIDTIDYRVNPARADIFYDRIRSYWPGLADGSLVPAYSGIRPKLSGPGENQADFLIQGPETHGVPGLFNLFGIESPGLTSSLAIAEHVATRI
ncbi:NAD(P)/FAD-dependent oxidoreductase [Mesorhizobium sp. SB112]|uniref:NAD(P)/FAD-dependent oxidoreductase n=1 Tax=Mesorhizobium sp. SB112 TaxID=3151853 RepID=UPI0032650E69